MCLSNMLLKWKITDINKGQKYPRSFLALHLPMKNNPLGGCNSGFKEDANVKFVYISLNKMVCYISVILIVEIVSQPIGIIYTDDG